MAKTRLLLILSMLFCLMTNRLYAQVDGTAAATVPQAVGSVQAAGDQWPELIRGAANYRLGNYEEAVGDLTTVRKQHPESAIAAYYLGVTLKKMQLIPDAIPQLKAAVTLQPPVKLAFLDLADAYYAADKREEALSALEECEKEHIEPGQTAFLKGVILASKRNYNAAKTSFDQAKAADAGQTAAVDYQIAMIYAQQGKITEAIALFTQLANSDPDSDLGGLARQQAEELAKRKDMKKFHASAGLQYQYDSNVVLEPDSLPTGSISKKADSAAVLTAQADYAPQLSGPYGLKFQYALYASAYAKLHTFDVQSHTAGVSSSYRFGDQAALLDVYGNYTLVDQEKYLQSVIVSPGYTFPTGEDQFAKVYAKYERKKFDYSGDFKLASADEDRSGNEVAGGISWVSLFDDQQGYVSIAYELNKDNTYGKNWSYLGNKLSVAYQKPIAESWKAGASVEAFLQKFDNARQDPTPPLTNTLIDRKDTTYSASVQAVYALTANIDAQIQLQYIKNDSTMDLYAYEKYIVGLGLNARF